MDTVSKTLYIPLYGKAAVSRKGVILHDAKAEEIWQSEGFPLRGKSKSKWLSYYMGMRAAVIDELTREALRARPEAAVLHLGCGLDARCERIGLPYASWYDVDLPDVIDVRRRFFREGERYRMLAGDAAKTDWLDQISGGQSAVIVMEGLSMYLTVEELRSLLAALAARFCPACLIMDAYTSFAARASKRANPIRSVGAQIVSGFDDPHLLESADGFRFTGAHSMTPDALIGELSGFERRFFRMLFAGRATERIYRLYTYERLAADGGAAAGRV